jgi:hypothetical protein
MKITDAVRAQLRLAIHARTSYFLFAMCTLPWAFQLAIMHMSGMYRELGAAAMDPAMLLSPVAPMICSVFGLLWGVMAWRDEPPRTRFYHWSLPVDTSHHDMARVAAYLLWLIAGLSAYLLTGIVVFIAYGVPLNLGAVGITPWVAAYCAGLIGFGIGAAFSTAFERPAEYLLGSAVLLYLAIGLAVIYRLETVIRIIRVLFGTNSKYSLGSAILRGGEVATLRYSGISPASHMSVAAPVALWLVIATTLLVASSYYNRGRAR